MGMLVRFRTTAHRTFSTGAGAGAGASADAPEADAAPVAFENTVYVKNLNFSSTPEGLQAMFANIGPVR